MEILQLLSALATRSIFLLHSILCFYILHHNHNINQSDNDLHWLLVIPMMGLLLESVMMLLYRNNEKWTFHYVWPAGLFYISSVVPVIVMVELQLFEQRLQLYNKENAGKGVS